MTGIVIVGAGECGTRAALSAREAGFEGAITLFGQESGMPYERPPLSKSDGRSAAKDIALAERLIGAGVCSRPEALSDCTQNLKLLLKRAKAA